jgi:hypothetical protein
MLHQTLSRGWCRDGSRLLLGLIVRPRGRLVEARVLPGATEDRSSRPAHRPGSFDPGHSCPVTPLPQRERLLEICVGAPALLLPYPLLPEPAKPAHPCPCARTTRSAACLCPGTSRAFGALPRARHHSYPGHREGEGFSQRVVLCGRASFGRSASKTEWVYGFKVALTVSPEGLITAFGVGEAASDERPIGVGLSAKTDTAPTWWTKGSPRLRGSEHWIEDYGALVVATPKDNSKRAWPRSDRRWAAGKCQIIEGVIDQLKDIFALKRHRAKTLGASPSLTPPAVPRRSAPLTKLRGSSSAP